MSKLEVVPVHKAAQEDLLANLDYMREAALKGKLVTLLYVKIDDEGSWVVNWAGSSLDRLKAIGAVEAIKLDLFSRAEDA